MWLVHMIFQISYFKDDFKSLFCCFRIKFFIVSEYVHVSNESVLNSLVNVAWLMGWNFADDVCLLFIVGFIYGNVLSFIFQIDVLLPLEFQFSLLQFWNHRAVLASTSWVLVTSRNFSLAVKVLLSTLARGQQSGWVEKAGVDSTSSVLLSLPGFCFSYLFI